MRLLYLLSLCISFLLTGCLNGNFFGIFGKETPVIKLPVAKKSDMYISNVLIAEGSQQGSGNETRIFFDSSRSIEPISKSCQTPSSGQSDKICRCQFTWEEINLTSGQATSVTRMIRTEIEEVQSYYVSCRAPDIYDTEIIDGTAIKINVVPASTANSTLSVENYTYTKGATDPSADFRDEHGRGFNNIMRYSCYERSKKGMSVSSRTQPTDFGGVPFDLILSTSFCAETGGAPVEGCQNAGTYKESAQSYYYNLFIPSSIEGGFNLSNQRYTCPLVKEALDNTGQPRPWPMDTSFALAKSPSAEFPVGVDAPSVLGIESDPSTAPVSCRQVYEDMNGGNGNGNNGNGGAPNSISYQCVGWAKLPESNGSCPSFKDENGNERKTYRLRRYHAIYPLSFEADGKKTPDPQAVDTIYVVDRPVKTQDPERTYSMRGPKPCPFSYFDHSGVLGQSPRNLYSNDGSQGRPTYRATHDASWAGLNPDGTHFPNQDSYSERSCSATLPITQYTSQGDPAFVTLATTHPSSINLQTGQPNQVSIGGTSVNMTKVYIRPMQPWSPHYVEDLEFQACAPLADTIIDPPLHFAKNDQGNVAWCSVAYPTQSDAIEKLDKAHQSGAGDPPPGYVIPFTSPVVKNSASQACSYTPVTIPGNYPSAIDPGSDCTGAGGSEEAIGAARHPAWLTVDRDENGNNLCSHQTCDRTVVNQGAGTWKGFPLTATPSEIETLLRNDPSYSCTITHDEGNGKKDRLTPTDGCCSREITGVQTGGAGGPLDTAHLEPDVRCAPPSY